MAKRKPKQGYLAPEMEPPTHKDLEAAAENYYDTMQDRVKLSAEEDEAKTALIEKMRSYNLERYEYDGKVVMITNKSNVKVKAAKRAEEEGEEGGEDE